MNIDPRFNRPLAEIPVTEDKLAAVQHWEQLLLFIGRAICSSTLTVKQVHDFYQVDLQVAQSYIVEFVGQEKLSWTFADSRNVVARMLSIDCDRPLTNLIYLKAVATDCKTEILRMNNEPERDSRVISLEEAHLLCRHHVPGFECFLIMMKWLKSHSFCLSIDYGNVLVLKVFRSNIAQYDKITKVDAAICVTTQSLRKLENIMTTLGDQILEMRAAANRLDVLVERERKEHNALKREADRLDGRLDRLRENRLKLTEKLNDLSNNTIETELERVMEHLEEVLLANDDEDDQSQAAKIRRLLE